MDDLIDRQAAIYEAREWIDAVYFEDDDERVRKAIWQVIGSLKNMPSAEPIDVPEKNVGKWTEKEVIHTDEAKEIITEWQSCKCSICGRYDTRPYLYYFNEPRFCSWCGVRMKGVRK